MGPGRSWAGTRDSRQRWFAVRRWSAGLLFLLLALIGIAPQAAAQFVTFTDPSEFSQFLATEAPVITFDDVASETVVPPGTAIDGVTFTVNAGELSGFVTNECLSVSPPNTFGVARGAPPTGCNNFFFAGDSVTLAFPQPIRAIGAYFSTNPVSDGTQGFISISTSAGTALSGNALPAGTFGFPANSLRFVGLASAVPFTEATFAISQFGFVVDNVIWSTSVLSTLSFARSVPDITIPPSGTTTAQLGDIEIDEMSPGVLLTLGQATVSLPPPLTFVGTPVVSTLVSQGLELGPATVGEGGDTLSFTVTSASSTGPAQILISNVRVAVPGDASSIPLCDTDLVRASSGSPTSSNPVCVTISGTNGITFVESLQVASFSPPATSPELTGTSITSVGAGATVTITLFGEALDQLTFSGPNRVALDFGPGIAVVPGSIRVSADGKSLTVKIQVGPNAQLGAHDVTIVGPDSEIVASLSGQITVNRAPTVTAAGTGVDGTGPLLSPATGDVLRGQTVIVSGTDFQAPTTVPSDLLASISGAGITVNSVSFDSSTQLSLDVDVAAGAQSVARRQVQVTNPDLGAGSSGAVLAVQLADSSGPPVGLAPNRTSGTATLPPAPTVTKIDPSSAPTGFMPVTITGTRFSATGANNFVTFTGPGQSQVLATILSARASVLTVQVPATAVDGPVTVAVSGVQQSTVPLNFTVSNPLVATATVGGAPASARRGDSVTTLLTGSKFQAGAVVSLDPPDDVTVGPVTVTPTRITVPLSIGLGAVLGLRDVVVINPDGGSSRLSRAFEVKLNSQFEVALTLKTVQGVPVDTGSFLPSVDAVQVTLDGNGKCTARTIAPTQYLLEASFPGTAPPTLPSMTVTLVSTNHAGTATNDDCEPNLALTPSLPAEPDWSVGAVGQTPDVHSQAVTLTAGADGVYRAQLASWDWGGSVHIDLADPTGSIGASLNLPVSGVPEGPDKTAADGLTDFEKFRGVYFVAPANGSTGALRGFQRLHADLTKRNLFVRGRGFALDPTLPAGSCGFDTSTGAPVPADPTVPCPRFQWGNAFAGIGVQVWDVTGSFDAGGTTVFPTRSLANPNQPMLDLATVTYDTANCAGGALCDHTSKLGPRQWNFPTLGFSTFGTCCVYGNAIVLGRPLKAYFLDRPYLHQANPPGTFLPTSGPLGPMLAPITIVCDNALKGSDNGSVQTGECSVNGLPGGDVFRPGQFDLDSSAMDTNNDGCVELPFVSDPSTLSQCDPTLDLVPQPSPQATFQQVARHLVTHELGHAAGSSKHTMDPTDLMYMYSINWTRDNHFSPQVGALIQIHNKGQQ